MKQLGQKARQAFSSKKPAKDQSEKEKTEATQEQIELPEMLPEMRTEVKVDDHVFFQQFDEIQRGASQETVFNEPSQADTTIAYDDTLPYEGN